ncbi:MAG: RNA-binding cell elongation regulator Jag/EloR [Bacilli bacterium]
MEKYKFTAKTKEAAIETALYELKEEDKNIIYTTKEVKSGLFGKKIEIEVVRKSDIIELIKETLINLTKKMGIDINIEIKQREENLNIIIFSEQNSLLIGKQGKNLEALSIILKQIIKNEISVPFKFNLDVGEYKLKREKELIRLAKRLGKEVQKTKEPIKLDSMNSYERRIIHNALNNWNNIMTESTGEEPNRCVVIKYKGDK